ncbi:MAG: CoA pyrophosphatase [Deltaproteobacteria bacterium]|nr:CoA pyrophosphatase [Deltaproteobacteria bacterium]
MKTADPRTSWITQIRDCLDSPPAQRLAPSEGRRAAVLVPLFVDAGELWTWLTRRTDQMPTHRSQIAFPGGGAEDGEESWGTALRESQEELGFEPNRVLRLGTLDEKGASSGFRVTPCVGAVPADFEPRIDPGEIAEAFRVPLTAFANPRMVEDRTVLIEGAEKVLRVYHVGSRQIWGLTAGILKNLLERLGLESVG